ncbi:MAG: hypothetical protein ACPG1C_01755 [Alphaproteobacteria bacterium]
MPAKDAGLSAVLERDARAAIKVHLIAAARLRDITRRGQRLGRRPKYVHAIEGQFHTHFGYLLIIDKLSEQKVWRFPFFDLMRTELATCAHYRTISGKSFRDRNTVSIVTRQFRFVRGAARSRPVEKFVSPLTSIRIVDDWSVEAGYLDGARYRITVMDNAKKGPMYRWLNTFKQYPLVTDKTYLRVKRLKRGRKVVFSLSDHRR